VCRRGPPSLHQRCPSQSHQISPLWWAFIFLCLLVPYNFLSIYLLIQFYYIYTYYILTIYTTTNTNTIYTYYLIQYLVVLKATSVIVLVSFRCFASHFTNPIGLPSALPLPSFPFCSGAVQEGF
jgi:hypothetical protein